MRLVICLAGILASVLPATAGPYQLIEAIGRNDLAAVRAELEAGTNPDAFPSEMATRLPVYLAARAGNAGMLALLVTFGADIDLRDGNGDRPLDWAARYGETEIVRLLVEAGAAVDPAPGEADANVPLVEALKGGHREAALILLDAGADPARADPFDGAPLHWAAARGDSAMAQRLLALGADPAAPGSRFGETPLHAAARRALPAMISLLVAAGSPIEARTRDGETPLYLAAQYGRPAAVQALLDAGANPDAADSRRVSPLMAAMAWRPQADWRRGIDDPRTTNRVLAEQEAGRWRDQAAAALLLARHSRGLDRALATAVWAGYGEVARLLIRRGARAVATDDSLQPRHDAGAAVLRSTQGPWVLGGAVNFPGMEMFDLLLAAGARIETQGADALVAAARAGRADIAARLLDAGVPSDAADRYGNTGLAAAAVEGQVEVVRLLTARGADASAKDAAGRGVAALMAARASGLACLAETREASRAWKPTGHIREAAAQLARRHGMIAAILDLDLPAPGRGACE